MKIKKPILIIVLLLVVLAIILISVKTASRNDVNNITQENIEGFGFANGSCNEDGSIFVQDSSIKNQVKVIENNANEKARCFADGSSYAFSVKLPTETFWCIDSSGFSGEITQDINSTSCVAQ